MTNPKVLIGLNKVKKAKGKNVIIGEERPEKKVLQNKTPQVIISKTLSLGGQDRSKKAGHAPIDPTSSQASLTGVFSKPGSSCKAKKKVRPSFKELLAKYKKKEVGQKRKSRPHNARDPKSPPSRATRSSPTTT